MRLVVVVVVFKGGFVGYGGFMLCGCGCGWFGVGCGVEGIKSWSRELSMASGEDAAVRDFGLKVDANV